MSPTSPALRVRRLTLEDLAVASEIERLSFDDGWAATAFESELRNNGAARYVLLERRDGAGTWRVIGFAGLWLQFDEAHVVTVAVLPEERRNGYGRILVHALVEIARHYSMADATLEARESNVAARGLYARYGFWEVGERIRYYADNGENAVIMTTEALNSERFIARIENIGALLRERFGAEAAPNAEAMGFE